MVFLCSLVSVDSSARAQQTQELARPFRIEQHERLPVRSSLLTRFNATPSPNESSACQESVAPEHVAPWTAGLELLARSPNVVVKLSGQGTFVRRVDEPLIRLVASTAIKLFGARRCLFGSNFPIESLWTDYATLVRTWRDALDADVRDDVLAATARRVYRLPA